MEIYVDPEFATVRDSADWWPTVGRGMARHWFEKGNEYTSQVDLDEQVTEFGELIRDMGIDPHDPDGLVKVQAAWTNFINPVDLGVMESRLLAVYKVATEGAHGALCSSLHSVGYRTPCDCWRDQVLTAIGNDDPWLR